MKKAILIFSIFIFANHNAQVKIGKNLNIPPDDSEILRIESANKGFLIPNVSIPDLNQPNPVVNPKDFLLVYNKNVSSNKGYYYWLNNKWNAIMDAQNIYEKLEIVKYHSVESNSAVYDNTLNTPTTYNLDETPSAHEWQLIPGLSKTINIGRSDNDVSISVSGIVQSNLSIASDSYAIAIFVDGKLKATRNFTLSSDSPCAYDNFNVQGVLENLTLGNHTFEVRETYRNNLRGTYTSVANLAFGAKNNNCSNINNEMARTSMIIKIVQK